MTEALIGIACGMLAAAAAFGIAGQIKHRPALQRGARLAGALGAVTLLAALVIHASLSNPGQALNTAGRALGLAVTGLAIAWLSAWQERPHAPASLWWVLGLAAALAGWAEFAASGPARINPASLAIGLLLLAAGGLAMYACGQALAILQARRAQDIRIKLNPALAMLVLAVLSLCAHNLIAVASFWPESPGFKSVFGAGLILFSARAALERKAGPWLVILGALALFGALLWPDAWTA